MEDTRFSLEAVDLNSVYVSSINMGEKQQSEGQSGWVMIRQHHDVLKRATGCLTNITERSYSLTTLKERMQNINLGMWSCLEYFFYCNTMNVSEKSFQ